MAEALNLMNIASKSDVEGTGTISTAWPVREMSSPKGAWTKQGLLLSPYTLKLTATGGELTAGDKVVVAISEPPEPFKEGQKIDFKGEVSKYQSKGEDRVEIRVGKSAWAFLVDRPAEAVAEADPTADAPDEPATEKAEGQVAEPAAAEVAGEKPAGKEKMWEMKDNTMVLENATTAASRIVAEMVRAGMIPDKYEVVVVLEAYIRILSFNTKDLAKRMTEDGVGESALQEAISEMMKSLERAQEAGDKAEEKEA
jgi:hypothetical protein